MSKEVVEFPFAGSAMIGRYPHIPIRYMLRGELRKALGVTADDEVELRERAKSKEAGEPWPEPFEASLPADAYSTAFVKAAAIGLCMPNHPDCKTLRQCRHDPVEYGEGVYDALCREYPGRPGLQAEVRTMGGKLIVDMVKAADALLVVEVAAEKDFTKGREGTGTDG